MNLIDKLNKRIEQGQASDRAVAQAAGVTLREFDADTTAPDERPECTDCCWFSPEPGHFTGARCWAPNGCIHK